MIAGQTVNETAEELEKCLNKVQEALNVGDNDKATRFALKAERIQHSDKAIEYLEILSKVNSDAREYLRNFIEKPVNEEAVKLKMENISKEVPDKETLKDQKTSVEYKNQQKINTRKEKPTGLTHNKENVKVQKESSSCFLFFCCCSNSKVDNKNQVAILSVSNRDDAAKCLVIAENAIAAGNLDKAEKFLLKAERMSSSEGSKALLKKVKELKRTTPQVTTSDSNSKDINVEDVTERNIQDEYHKVVLKQMEAMQRIKESTNDYEVLGLPCNSSLSDIKAAHRSLTRLLHPDKNHLEGAQNAFILLNDAAERLKSAKS